MHKFNPYDVKTFFLLTTNPKGKKLKRYYNVIMLASTIKSCPEPQNIDHSRFNNLQPMFKNVSIVFHHELICKKL